MRDAATALICRKPQERIALGKNTTGGIAMSDDVHEVYAIRYGHHSRPASANYIDGDPHDVLQPLDFFVWAIVRPSGTIVVDTGFDEAMGKKRQREMIKPVREGLPPPARGPRSRAGGRFSLTAYAP